MVSAVADTVLSVVKGRHNGDTVTPVTGPGNCTAGAPSPRNRSASVSSTASITDGKYRLRVTAGPSLDPDTQQVVRVNTAEPCAFENDFMKVEVKVRIKNFKGLPSTCPPTDATYFSHPLHTSDRYSIAFSFIPKRTLPAHSAFWGNEFSRPIRDRLPPGFNTAFNIVKKIIDPGLECDAYADRPWLLGPSLGCWFAFWVGEKAEEPGMPEIIKEGGEGSGLEVRRKIGVPEDAKERRRWALNKENRAKLVFEQGREYRVDFFNPYLDFSKFSVCLPGFSVCVIKYIDDKTHKLRYVFKDKETGDIYFAVTFTLLFGQELEQALAAEARARDN
ncbi:uncharacterized protein C8Q71DRAFT_224487 [Rhodofomes roseus]|uniref:Domain of unknown function at the cortex 1 domain-containing protein n=1 Tax=Rhodofomes roseus TaxID=34475 RepID=A0ABQ8KV09_9APHY|nr:uncharacterized protein C8Q71DRAFT_224487 [Rhodofomes roseus]KAH9842856.1 hypothetical protein C8Q71DRAFT_224487 [Rhodofomes roseus]